MGLTFSEFDSKGLHLGRECVRGTAAVREQSRAGLSRDQSLRLKHFHREVEDSNAGRVRVSRARGSFETRGVWEIGALYSVMEKYPPHR